MTKVRYTIHLTEPVDPVPPECKDLHRKFGEVIQRIDSVLAARRQFVWKAKAKLSDDRTAALCIWKGGATPNGKNKRSAAHRLYLQFVALSPDAAVVTPISYVPHDVYMASPEVTFPVPLPAALSEVISGPQTGLDPEWRLPAVIARPVWSLLPAMKGGHVRHSASLELSHVEALLGTEEDDSSPEVHPEPGGVRIGDEAFCELEYPREALFRWESREVLSRAAAHQATNPVLRLGDEERAFLGDFGSGSRLPAFIDGSAGSGKTTLLGFVMLDLVARHHSDEQFPLPLFVTHNRRLLGEFRPRLKNGLKVFHGVPEAEADRLVTDSCRTLDDLVDRALGRPPRSMRVSGAAQDFRLFTKWWTGTGSGANDYRRGGAHLEDTYRMLRMSVLGKVSFVADGDFSFGTNRDIVERLLEDYWGEREGGPERVGQLIDILEKFLRAVYPDGSLFSDVLHQATQALLSDQQPLSSGVVIIDEAQDMSSAEVEFVLANSSLRSSAPLLPSEHGYVPLIVAGDELQSVIPSGFTFERTRTTICELAALHGLDLHPGDLRPTKLTKNFRSTKKLVDFGNAARRLSDETAAQAIAVRNGGQGRLARLVGTPETPIVDIVVLVPEISSLAGDSASLAGPLSGEGWDRTPIDLAKGNEYPVVVIDRFGDALLAAKGRGGIVAEEWLLNALHVAATRARDSVYISDTDAGFAHLCERFERVGYHLRDADVAEEVEVDNQQALAILRLQLQAAVDAASLVDLEKLAGKIEKYGDRALKVALRAWQSALSPSSSVPWGEMGGVHHSLRDEVIEWLVDRGEHHRLVGALLDFTRPPRRSSWFATVVVAQVRHGDPGEEEMEAVVVAIEEVPAYRWAECSTELSLELTRWARMPPRHIDPGVNEWWIVVADAASRKGYEEVRDLALLCSLDFAGAEGVVESVGDGDRRTRLRQVLLQRRLWWIDEECRATVADEMELAPRSLGISEVFGRGDVASCTMKHVEALVSGDSTERLAVAALLSLRCLDAQEAMKEIWEGLSGALGRRGRKGVSTSE